MEFQENDSIINDRTNLYKGTFFHMYLEGKSPINNTGFNEISKRDYASFIHEYVHYLQQITTPYGIKYNRYFNNNLILFREEIESTEKVILPFNLKNISEPINNLENELREKNGSKHFSLGNIDDIEINIKDLCIAEVEDTAVNVGVYDFENNKIFEHGFKFGYWCVMESMAHLIQTLVNSDLNHSKVPYQAAQLICNKLKPEIQHDIKLLISICYTALYFNNPGLAYFKILQDVKVEESGIELYQRYMRDYPRQFEGEEMPNYRMMHMLLDDFGYQLESLLGTDLIYMKETIKNCKIESSSGNSMLLNILYNADLNNRETLIDLLEFYGYPAIDSGNDDIVVPFNPKTKKPYVETASLISLELITDRIKQEKKIKICPRYSICDKVSRKKEIELIDVNCSENQWNKKIPCLFNSGLSYWTMSNKKFKY